MRKIIREVLRRKYGNKHLKLHYRRYRTQDYNYIANMVKEPTGKRYKAKKGIWEKLKDWIMKKINKKST